MGRGSGPGMGRLVKRTRLATPPLPLPLAHQVVGAPTATLPPAAHQVGERPHGVAQRAHAAVGGEALDECEEERRGA